MNYKLNVHYWLWFRKQYNTDNISDQFLRCISCVRLYDGTTSSGCAGPIYQVIFLRRVSVPDNNINDFVFEFFRLEAV